MGATSRDVFLVRPRAGDNPRDRNRRVRELRCSNTQDPRAALAAALEGRRKTLATLCPRRLDRSIRVRSELRLLVTDPFRHLRVLSDRDSHGFDEISLRFVLLEELMKIPEESPDGFPVRGRN